MTNPFKRRSVSLPPPTRASSYIVTDSGFDDLCAHGYTRLSDCPEIVTACRAIADAISTMTIHLMSNSDTGDYRIINELSRKIDIAPNRLMSRKQFIDFVIMTLLLYGEGNAVVLPKTNGGILTELEPIPASRVSFLPEGNRFDYRIRINGSEYLPEELLHFVFNPDANYPFFGSGLSVQLRDVANNLRQAAVTEKGFLSSKWKPSLVVKVDGLVNEFSGPEGRKKLLDEYISTTGDGEPWLIPAEQFDIKEVRPLSLSDLAISDVVTLDKRTAASIVGVPSFVVGIGEYNATAWNGFINNTVRPIARIIEQELTRKLLISPKWYFRFNINGLYAYDIKTIADTYSSLRSQGIVTGNEVRDKLSLPPLDGLDELVVLENYIPLNKIGDQLKLMLNKEA